MPTQAPVGALRVSTPGLAFAAGAVEAEVVVVGDLGPLGLTERHVIANDRERLEFLKAQDHPYYYLCSLPAELTYVVKNEWIIEKLRVGQELLWVVKMDAACRCELDHTSLSPPHEAAPIRPLPV